MKNKKLTLLLIYFLFIAGISACSKSPVPASTSSPTSLPVKTEVVTPLAIPTEALQPTLQNTEPAAITSIPPTSAPLSDGKTLMETRCTVCHSLARITSKTESFDEWKGIVARMIGNGAVLSGEEEAVLVKYLADTFKDN